MSKSTSRRPLPFVQTGDGAGKAPARPCLHVHCRGTPSSPPSSKTRRASARTSGKAPDDRRPQIKGMARSWTSGKAPDGHCHISWQALMVLRLQFKIVCHASYRLDSFIAGAWVRVGRRLLRRVPRPHQPTRQRQVQRHGLLFPSTAPHRIHGDAGKPNTGA